MNQKPYRLKKLPKAYLALIIASCFSSTYAADQAAGAGSQQEKPGSLAKVVVEADATDEDSYLGKQASTSTKLDLSVKETPQSITVIPRKQINDMGVTNLGQLLQQTTGVILTGDNSERTNFSIRGFNVGDGWNSNLMQYDGIPINASNVGSSKPDTAMIESVEILRGAAGLMQGSGEPSGAINIIRKKPTKDFQASGALSYGSWDSYRAEADISNRLNESGTVRGRLVAAYQDADSYMTAVTRDTNLVYGVLSADLTTNTLLNIGYKRQAENAIGAHNLPRNPRTGEDLELSRKNCSCNYSDFWDKENTEGFIDIEHIFDNGWSVKGAYVRANISMDMVFTSLSPVAASLFNPENPQGNLNKYAYQYDQTIDVYDLFSKGSFTLFGRSHELVLGANSQKSYNPGRWTSWDTVLDDYTLWNRSGTAPRPLLSVDLDTYSPYDLPYIPARYELDGGRSYEDRSQTGIYIATRLNLTDPLKLILGVRQSDFEFDSRYKSNVTNQFVESKRSRYERNDVATPYVGLTFDINKTYTAYASFADTFVVQSARGASGAVLDPIQGNGYEAGVKGSFNDEKVIASVAAFRINQINRAILDESTPGKCPLNGNQGYCNIAAGEVVSEGIETELRGEFFPGFNATLGYTYNTTEYKKDLVNQGRVFNETTPKHLARLFATYEFANQLTLGGGVNYQSEWLTGRYNAVSARQDDYMLVNLMASYPINDSLTLAANADNALDEIYYSYISATSNRYGEPRNMKITLRAKF